MGVIKTATTKTAKISGRQQYSRSASPLDENAPGMGGGGNGVSGNGMSLEEVQRYCKEPLTAHEAHILQKQIERLEKEGKVGRALNIAMFTRSCVLAFRKTGERPPAVSEGPWNKYLEDGNVVDLRRSFTPEQSAFWEYRSKILQAHHAVTFPDYKFRPKHLTREEKEVKIAEKNRKRVARGESPLPTTLPRRGRPAKLKATVSAPAHLINSAAPRSGRGVSPTSSTSRPGSPRLAAVIDMARPAPLQFTPFDPSGMRNSRDDGAALYEFGRRRSSATHYFLRGQVTTDPRRTIDLPGGMSDFSAPFGAATGAFGGAGLGLDAPLPMQGELFGQQAAGSSRGTRKPTSLEDGLVPNISQRRNSEFMPLPFPTIVPPHVPAVSHNMFGNFGGFGQIPEYGAHEDQQQQDSIWTNTNPFAASMPVGQTTPTLYDGFVGMAPHQRVPAPIPFGNAAAAPAQEYIAPASEPVYAPAEYSYARAGETQALQFGWDATAVVADHNPLNLTLDIPAAAESQDYDAGFEFVQTQGFESSESSPGSTDQEFVLY